MHWINKTKKGSADPNLWHGLKKEMRGEIQAKPASVLFGGDFYSDDRPLNRQRYHGSSGLSSTANTASTLSTEMLDFLESAVNGGSEDVKSVISDDKSVVGNDNVKTAIIHSEYFEPVSYKDIFEQNGEVYFSRTLRAARNGWMCGSFSSTT